jgi:hypothetical protein
MRAAGALRLLLAREVPGTFLPAACEPQQGFDRMPNAAPPEGRERVTSGARSLSSLKQENVHE